MEVENKELLLQGAKDLGLALDRKAVEAFDLYLRELSKWNQRFNLTAIGTEKGVVIRHFLDSLSIHPYLPKKGSLLDLGSGAGFPGIPIKIVQPCLHVVLIDSVLKKVHFQRHVIRLLHLRGIEAVHARIQDRDLVEKYREGFDTIVSRAFSSLGTFLVLARSFLKPGGRLIAMKGGAGEEEMRSLSAAERSGYRLRESRVFLLPSTSLKRTILLFEKD